MDSRTKTKENSIHELKGRIHGSLSGLIRAGVVTLLVFFQFFVIIWLPFILSNFTLYFYTILEVLSIIVIISLVNDNRSPSYKISWICIVLALPISGHIMYALWGKSDSKRKLEGKVIAKMQHGFSFLERDPIPLKKYEAMYPTKARITKYMNSQHFPLFENNKVSYFSMGEDIFFDIFNELNKAKKFILIEFFIVAEGAIWDKMHDILLKKIGEGVKVMFIYDDFGAMLRTHKGFRHELEMEGFEIRVFNPVHKYTDKLYMNYRTHQKIVVIDGNIGYTGGFNIADEYANLIGRFGLWKDNAVKIEGEAVWGLTVTFLQMWEVCSTGSFIDYYEYRPTKEFKKNNVFCQVISDGPANNPNNPIENIYKQMITYANKFLYIMTPYLIIEDDMKEALITAVRSGIDVRIITPNIPDKKNVKRLTNYNYGELLKNGVRIYEYTPGFIHAKTIINEDCGIVGTINMDYRSFYLHYECGVWMSNKEIIDTIRSDFMETFEESHEYTYPEWKNRPLALKLYQPVLNMFSTLM